MGPHVRHCFHPPSQAPGQGYLLRQVFPAETAPPEDDGNHDERNPEELPQGSLQEAQVRSHQAYGTLLRQARGYQGRRCRGGAQERYLKSCSERFQTSLALSCALSDLQVPTCGMVLRLALGYSNK